MVIKPKLLFRGVALLLIIAGLWPYNRIVTPAVHLQILSESGQPASGILVKQEWRDWSAEFTEHGERSITDSQGYVDFSERTIRSCHLCVAAIVSYQVLKAGPHAGIGPFLTIEAYGSDPHVSAFVNYNSDETLPTKLSLKRWDTTTLVRPNN